MNEDGSFLLVEYTVKVKETGELVETTDVNVAKDMNAYDEKQVYGPRLFIIGSGDTIKAFESKLREASLDETNEITVTPEEGYGPRDPSKVRIYPMRKFAGIRDLEVGTRVEIDGRIGIVKSMSSGRVSVDFNPPLAGKTLLYQFKVVSKIEQDLDKVKAIVRRMLPRFKEEAFDIELSDGVAKIKLPPEVYYLDGLPTIKRSIFSQISRYIRTVDRVIFIEEYVKEREPEKAEAEVGEKEEVR